MKYSVPLRQIFVAGSPVRTFQRCYHQVMLSAKQIANLMRLVPVVYVERKLLAADGAETILSSEPIKVGLRELVAVPIDSRFALRGSAVGQEGLLPGGGKFVGSYVSAPMLRLLVAARAGFASFRPVVHSFRSTVRGFASGALSVALVRGIALRRLLVSSFTIIHAGDVPRLVHAVNS
jgi:hypothetical protein